MNDTDVQLVAVAIVLAVASLNATLLTLFGSMSVPYPLLVFGPFAAVPVVGILLQLGNVAGEQLGPSEVAE